MRLLLERLLLTVLDGSEQVRLECHWHGGNQTAHTLVRPVAEVIASLVRETEEAMDRLNGLR